MNLRRTCMRQQIRDIILERILDGTYPAGARLKEMVLATEFEVSQAPVREALRELETIGMVECELYRGTRVHSADIRQLDEAYELRALLEERAAQLAVPCAPEVIATIESALERMRGALDRLDFKDHTTAVMAFHRTLVVASGNATFVRVWDSLKWEVRTRIAVQRLHDRGVAFEPFLETRQSVVAALKRGDGFAAGRHLRELAERVRGAMDQPVPTLTLQMVGGTPA